MLGRAAGYVRRAFTRHLRRGTYALVGREVSRVTRYADRLIHLDPVPGDDGLLLGAIEAPLKRVSAREDLADVTPDGSATVILLNGNLNHSTDIQGLLAGIGCIDCKKILIRNVFTVMEPIWERRTELLNNPERIRNIADKGTEKARKVVQGTMNLVREAMGL